MATMKRILSSVIVLFVLTTASFAANEALQIDALWSGLNNPTNGKSYSGAIVATFAADGSTAKAVWENKEKTAPSTLGKAQFTLDSNGQAEVFGDGVYVIKVYAPSDTGLTNPLMTFDGLTYIINVDPSNEGVDSVSDLRGGSGGAFDGYILTLLGYYIPGDDGGQPLYWDESSVETGNGFSVFKVTSVTTGRWKSVDALSLNAKHAGVKTDGTDNTTEIQNYFSLVEEAVFNSGDYVGGPFTIPSTLRVIRGIGFPTLEAPAVDTRVIEDTTGSDLLITGMNFTGVAGSAEGSAAQLINLISFSKVKIIGNKFTNGFHRAIYLTGCTDFEVSGNEFTDCSNGPYFTGCQRGIISQNTINGSQQDDGTFKVGIALQTFDATYGLNQDITISDNIINDLQNSQAILGHGGIGINVHGNVTTGCAQGINFNRQTSGDNIIGVSIMNNRCEGIGAGVSYTPAADVGIVVSGTGETTGNIVVSGNTLRYFNLKGLADGLGGISIIAIDNLVISSNTIRDCASVGIGFSGADSTDVQVYGNVINNISGSTAHAGIKVTSPTIVTGIFTNNWITDSPKAYRIESTGLFDLIVESDTEYDNTAVSVGGTTSVLFNRSLQSTDLDATPSVNHNVKFLIISNSVATDVTDLDDGITGQIVTIRFSDSNTTVKDFSNGGNFHLAGNADYTPGTKDTLAVVSTGGEWLEVSRSDN